MMRSGKLKKEIKKLSDLELSCLRMDVMMAYEERQRAPWRNSCNVQ